MSEFIAKREGDRIGLILFADHAYLQTPLTLDRQTVANQLNQTVLKLIGTQTAIGEGIGLATKTFIDSDAPQRVMILLSDGSNTAGVLDPLEAANIAKQYNTTIYTVGVGAGEMVVKDFLFSRKVNTAQDLDEKTLQTIATPQVDTISAPVINKICKTSMTPLTNWSQLANPIKLGAHKPSGFSIHWVWHCCSRSFWLS